jgi:CheY-like chemotaxis protein
MVHGFVRQSGGAATVQSQLHRGTTFSLFLPRAVGAEARPVLLEREAAGGTPPRGEVILVVEDSPEVMDVVQLSLIDAGYRVAPALDGPEAIEILTSGARVDLLFSDVTIPGGMTGIEVARRAQQLRPGLPVLLTTGYAAETLSDNREQFEVLAKPYKRGELLARVAEALARRTAALQHHSAAAGVGSR